MSISPSTGHPEIDSQHAKLDHLVEKAMAFCSKIPHPAASCAACTPDQQTLCRREVMVLTRELLKFMAGHFRYEEKLMRSLPDNDICRDHVARHKRDHADISEWVSALTAKLATTTSYAIATELRDILTDWTGAHVSGLDSSMVKLHQQTGHRELDEDTELAVLLAKHRLELQGIRNDHR
jgi:hemerythrin-like metal-binding protein